MSTKDRIVETALRLFNERSIHEVGVRDIARELGISPGNLSYHFPKKEDLLNELLNRLSAGNDACYQHFFSGEITTYSYLQLLDRIYHNQYHYRSFYLSMVELNRHMARIGYDYAAVAERRRSSLTRIFLTLVDNGEFRPDTTQEDINDLVAFLSLVNRFWISESALLFSPNEPEKAIRHYLRLVARQLGAIATDLGREGIVRFWGRTT